MSKRLCSGCHHKRADHLFPKGHRLCELCKIAKKHGQKLEKKAISKSVLGKKLMLLVKKYIHIRDNNTCQWCGKGGLVGSNCQVSHVIPVSAGKALSYEPTNMKILCYHCHLNVWHKHPRKASTWFKNKFPDRDLFLTQHENDEVHWKSEDYQRMIEEWERKLQSCGV